MFNPDVETFALGALLREKMMRAAIADAVAVWPARSAPPVGEATEIAELWNALAQLARLVNGPVPQQVPDTTPPSHQE